MQNSERAKWSPVVLLTENEHDYVPGTKRFAVRVSKLPLFHPRYSYEVGVMLPPKIHAVQNAQPEQRDVTYDPVVWRFAPHFSLDFQVQNGTVMKHTTLTQIEIILRLLERAAAWVHEQVQLHEDEIQEQRRERELRDVNRNKPETRVTGKTARKQKQA